MNILFNVKRILLILVVLASCMHCHREARSKQGDLSQIPFPHLMYMAPKDVGSYTMNERNSLTQELNTGWVLKENEEVDFMLYLFVKERITDLSQVVNSYVYFTLHQNVCNETNLEVYDHTKKYSETATYAFKLNFDGDRSKLYGQNNKNSLRRVTKGARMQRDVNSQSNQTNGMSFEKNTLLVGNATIRLKHGSPKYYACVHFESNNTQNRGVLNYVHQGDLNLWCNVVTQQDLLPIWAVVILYLILLMFSSLCSGLNLGKSLTHYIINITPL